MGFLGDFFSGAGKVIKGFLGIPQAAAPVAAPPAPMVAPAPAPAGLSPVAAALLGPAGQLIRVGQQAAGGLARLIVGTPAELAAQREAAGISGPAGALAMGARGNGRFVKQTTVQTFDLTTGQVVRSVVLEGAPFLMNREVRALSAVAKKVRKANAKIPSKTKRASALSELRDATVQQALQAVRTVPARALCPPS